MYEVGPANTDSSFAPVLVRRKVVRGGPSLRWIVWVSMGHEGHQNPVPFIRVSEDDDRVTSNVALVPVLANNGN